MRVATINRTVTVFFLLASALRLMADDNSARRYAALETSSTIFCKYSLLATEEVRASLKLTADQIASLKSAMGESPAANPGVAELRRSQQEKLKAASTEEERARIRLTGNEKVMALVDQSLIAKMQ